jgi:subtilisin-like proprotein convertase family protein/subtilisin family serine protease
VFIIRKEVFIMAKKNSPRKVKTKADDGLRIERGGESFKIEKSKDHFAVKRKTGSGRGALSAAAQNPNEFPGLEFSETQSSKDVEVYRINADSLDHAMKILRTKSSEVIWCAHVYHMPGDPDGLMIPTDSIYVEFQSEAAPELINQLMEQYDLELMPAREENTNAFIVRLTSASTENPIKIANALRRSGAVTLAEPDFSIRISFKAYRPSDTLFPQQWHLENRGGYGLTAGADVSAPDAWDIERGDRSIVVCVMDDGVQVDHPEFSSPGKIIAPFDFGQNDPDPSPVRPDDDHGTACAGVAVADENGEGVVGLAPNCALMPIRTSGIISNESIRDLFDYARINGADVISCSWGVNAAFFSLSTPMFNAIRRAAQEGRGGRGCVIFFAAGNEDSPLDGTKDGVRVRSGFAIHPDVIAVSASNSHDVRSHYSNYGPQVWVCAPSSGSGGRRIVTTDRTGVSGYQSGDYTTVNGFGGTSSATPLVAGLCGLILSVNPELSSSEVKDILKETADKIDIADGNYNAEGHSEWYGWGRVNAFRAVQGAQRRLPPIPTRQVLYERTPGLPIPDFNSGGITDAIRVGDPAILRSLEVSLDISHTYRGDLRVRLIAPDDTVVLLHDRSGGSRDDLIITYSTGNNPRLADLAGKIAQGNWVLQVADLASADTGTLNRWALLMGLEGGPRTEWEANPGLIIPDNDPQGIVSEISVEVSGVLRDIALTVDINHSWQGDLRVALESPSGLSAQIHNLTGGPADNLKQTYRAGDTPALQALVDAETEINGTWRLRVADHAPRDVGKLNAWKLKLVT